MQKYIPIVLLVVFSSCWGDFGSQVREDFVVDGYVPTYSNSIASEIRLIEPQTVTNPGKIYLYDHFLLVNEKYKGIHIYDNTNPENPVALGFAQLIGNSDMAMRNGILYADHMGNLVALETSDFTKLVQRGELPIHNWLYGVPPPSQSYFECIDQERGLVVGWKHAKLTNPDCYAN